MFLFKRSTKTPHERLIEWLEKEGFTEQANSLRNGATTLNLQGSIFNSDKKIGYAGVKDIAEALKTNSTLTTLDLGYNQIGDSGAKEIASVLKTNSTLTTLNLGNNKIGDSGAKEIAAVLKTNSTLTTLNLYNNQIGYAGVKDIAEALKTNSTLTTLDLGYNQIGDSGAKEIASVLKTNSTLTTLNLGNNKIGDSGAKEIAAVLKTNSTLTTLNLYNNQIGYAGAKEIEERICYNNELVKKLSLLLCSYFKSAYLEFKVLTASKFYQVVNKQLLKKYLQEKGIDNIEANLTKVNDLIKMKPFAIAGVCKKIQPNTEITADEWHISRLPDELIVSITSYLDGTASFIKLDTSEFFWIRLCSRTPVRSAGSPLNSSCLNLSEFSCTPWGLEVETIGNNL